MCLGAAAIRKTAGVPLAAELGRKALFDNQGRRLMRGLEQLAEAERSRMERGSLAVPYGACVEPANVASMGGACKFMLKCLGRGR